MRILLALSLILLTPGLLLAQNKYQKKQNEKKDIVTIIDELTLEWDEEAAKLETYEGLKTYCRVKPYREKMVDLLDQIHHYDTSLYMIVTAKYADKEDPEAKATLEDIKDLEMEYPTRALLEFLHKECNSLNDIERNFGKSQGEEYEKEVGRLEKEAQVFISAITRKIDLIDEHVHHLDALN